MAEEDQNLVNATDYDELERIIESELEEADLRSVKKISYSLSKIGLSLPDACLLARRTPEYIRKLCKDTPELNELFRIKELEYKADMLRLASQKALNAKNEKLAFQLLQHRFPEDFKDIDRRRRADTGDDPNNDPFALAIAFVRKMQSDDPPVNKQAGNNKKTLQLESDEKGVYSILK